MTTLRDTIDCALSRAYFAKNDSQLQSDLDHIMSAIDAEDKRRYGWTEDDCPFSYGEEIEVSDDRGEPRRAIFSGYCPDRYRKYLSGESDFKYARSVQKQEEKEYITAENIIDGKQIIYTNKRIFGEVKPSDVTINGKKYKLVEVE